MLATFALALLIVYLALAAQFESFLHLPLVIMLTVPLGVLGALIGLWVTGGTVNLFADRDRDAGGLGRQERHSDREFANQLRDEGRAVRDAIIEAAGVRLRPILMTSIATVMGAVPLVVFGGPGSASRATIGIVGGSGTVLHLPVAVRGAGVLRRAGALHALARGWRAPWRRWKCGDPQAGGHT